MESLDASLLKDTPKSYRALRGASVTPYNQARLTSVRVRARVRVRASVTPYNRAGLTL